MNIKTTLKSSIVIVALLIPASYPCLAEPYLDPIAKTNINKIDPLFEESIQDYKGFEKDIDDVVGRGIENTKNQQAYKDLGVEGNIDEKAAELSKIEAKDLNSRGREEFTKDPDIDGIFVDYSKPGMMQHKDDAKLIADASSNLVNNLIDRLKELGIVDCKQVKGNKIIEPEYFIETEQIVDRKKGDTVYDKQMCEQLYNRYSCTDSLTLTCLRKGMRYEEWQDKTIEIPGGDIYWQHNNWVRSIKWKASRFGIHMRAPEPALMNEIRTFIAIANGVGLEHIHEYITYEERGEGNIFHLEGKSHTWDKFIFKYKYRDGKMVCLDWKEDWSERCRLYQ